MNQIEDLYRDYNFVLDIGEGPVGYFNAVSGLAVDVDVVEYREGGAGPAVRKLTGRPKYSDVRLKWGLSSNRDLWDWMQTATRGDVDRRHISIILTSPGGDEQMRFNLMQAWPSSWRGAELDALGNEVAIEEMTLVHEGLERA